MTCHLKQKKVLLPFTQDSKSSAKTLDTLAKPVIYLTISWLFNLSQYILVFFALGIFNQSFSFFIIIYFVAGSLTDVSASFSVGTLDILLATIFVLYGLNPALSGITAALVRSVTFWSPLIIGYIIVQIVGAKNVLAPPPRQEESSITAPKATGAIREPNSRYSTTSHQQQKFFCVVVLL